MDGPYDPRRWTYETSRPESRRRADPAKVQPADIATQHSGVQDPGLANSVQPNFAVRDPQPRSAVRASALTVFWHVKSKSARTDLDPTLKAYVDRAVERAISRALRDPVGRRDFALLADGAILLPELTEVVTSDGMRRGRDRGTRPEVALNDDMRIGNCWSIPGTNGQLGFRLATMIRPTHVSIDHIPTEIAADISRAPREVALWGGVDGPYEDILRNFTYSRRVNLPTLYGRSAPFTTHGYNFTLLAHFEYDIRAPTHIQTFRLLPYVVESDMVFGVVVLEILSNWGGKSTCLYRVRVHGEVADVPL
ncbi:hypothetical protein GSI_05720 [Ganoderma sinense ZZ0214-1]|uniref:SUN domain-containing protein n=1 Tax=Ganoderma sinense ZZ0214-1 TaxID=1077348 RepID=A0A2G8SB87_9APHY|nr:hypothetical protein GSI_05720 [Ganoderma sinense ZZ0214-1]